MFSTTVNVSVVPDSSTSVDPSSSWMVYPAVSSSVVVTETVWFSTASYPSSELASSIETVIDVTWFPSTAASSTPVTVTVCAVSQLAEVKVRVDVTVASPVSFDVRMMTTSDVG